MRKKFLFAAVALLLSAPMYADQVQTSCGKKTDLPAGWEDMNEDQRKAKLAEINQLICAGFPGEAVVVPEEKPSTEANP